jgi:uncharacterized protein YbjT (DUF2867 family)
VNVTVFGATGVVGQALLPLLAEHDVTAVSRKARDEPDVRYVVADAATGKGVAPALERADVVYYLVHSLGGRDYEQRDRAAAETVAQEAASAGVQQIVYLGGLGGDDPDASPHLRSRRETGERLASAGIPVTTLRAAMIVGKGSAAFETILALIKRLPVMVTPSWVSTPTQPIALDDVARYLAGVCGNEAAFGDGYDVGGQGAARQAAAPRFAVARRAFLDGCVHADARDGAQRVLNRRPRRRSRQARDESLVQGPRLPTIRSAEAVGMQRGFDSRRLQSRPVISELELPVYS